MNVSKHSDVFDDSRVPIWVFEEEVRERLDISTTDTPC